VSPTRPGRLRVAHLITRLELGGAQQNTLHTVRHIDPERFEAHLVCGRGGYLDEEAAGSGVPVTFVDDLVRRVDPWRDLVALRKLTALWRRLRPDIVHTHSSKAGVLGRLAARLAGVPVVVHTVHGYGFHPGQPLLRRTFFRSAERIAARLTTHFIVVSEANQAEGLAMGLFGPERVSLIRSGVELERFRSSSADRDGLGREWGIPPEAPVVGMVACLKPQKAPLDFVEVARRVAKTAPEAHFVLVGDGDLRPAVESAVTSGGLDGHFHLLGWRRDVDRLMKGFDVLVHTSRWEGLPRVFPEAMAAGLPVIATDVDGAADVVRDGENGYLLRAGDLGAIAARTLDLLADPGARRRMGDAGLRDSREFDIDFMVERQETLYHDLWARVAG